VAPLCCSTSRMHSSEGTLESGTARYANIEVSYLLANNGFATAHFSARVFGNLTRAVG